MWPSILILALVAAAFAAVVVTAVRRRKSGKVSCSCGGTCGACGMDCHKQEE